MKATLGAPSTEAERDTLLTAMQDSVRAKGTATLHGIRNGCGWSCAVAHALYAACTGVVLGCGNPERKDPKDALFRGYRPSDVVSAALAAVVKRCLAPVETVELLKDWAKWHGAALAQCVAAGHVATPVARILDPHLTDQASRLIDRVADTKAKEGERPVTRGDVERWLEQVQSEAGCGTVRLRVSKVPEVSLGATYEPEETPAAVNRMTLRVATCPEVATLWRPHPVGPGDDAAVPSPMRSLVTVITKTKGSAAILRLAPHSDQKLASDDAGTCTVLCNQREALQNPVAAALVASIANAPIALRDVLSSTVQRNTALSDDEVPFDLPVHPLLRQPGDPLPSQKTNQMPRDPTSIAWKLAFMIGISSDGFLWLCKQQGARQVPLGGMRMVSGRVLLPPSHQSPPSVADMIGPCKPLIPSLCPVHVTALQLLTISVGCDENAYRMKRQLLGLLAASPIVEPLAGADRGDDDDDDDNIGTVAECVDTLRDVARIQPRTFVKAVPAGGVIFHVLDEDVARDAIIGLCQLLSRVHSARFRRGVVAWFAAVDGPCHTVAAPDTARAGFFKLRKLDKPQDIPRDEAVEVMSCSVRKTWEPRRLCAEDKSRAAQVVQRIGASEVLREMVPQRVGTVKERDDLVRELMTHVDTSLWTVEEKGDGTLLVLD